MQNLVTVEVAAELLDTTPSALITMASLKRKKDGQYYDWYISNGKRGAYVSYIDISIIQRNNAIRKRAWNYATDTLYWLLESLEGYCMQDFARILASKTNDSKNSWAMFMSRDMWNIPNGNVYELKETKLFNFIRIMTMLIYGSSHDIRIANHDTL